MGKVGNTRCEPRSDTDRLDGQTEETIYVIQGGGRTSLNVNGKGWDTDISFTLNATDVHGIAYVYDARGNGNGGTSPTITGDHQNRITDYTAIVLEVKDEEDTDAEQCERSAEDAG